MVARTCGLDSSSCHIPWNKSRYGARVLTNKSHHLLRSDIGLTTLASFSEVSIDSQNSTDG